MKFLYVATRLRKSGMQNMGRVATWVHDVLAPLFDTAGTFLACCRLFRGGRRGLATPPPTSRLSVEGCRRCCHKGEPASRGALLEKGEFQQNTGLLQPNSHDCMEEVTFA